MVAMLCATGTPAEAKINLTFGTYAADKPTDTVRKFRPVLNALEKALARALGEPVAIRSQISLDYNKGIDDLVKGRVDFARFGPASYVMAKEKAPGIRLLAMEAVKGTKTFHGIIAVHTDSPIRKLADLRGHSFAFGSKLSTIGRYLSQMKLVEAGIRARDLEKYEYLGRHDRVGRAVGNGAFDAGALKESTFKKLVKREVPIRALASFENVTKPWVARAGLPPRIVSALSRVLVALKDPAALKRIKKSGFIEGKDSDYDVIRRAIAKSAEFVR